MKTYPKQMITELELTLAPKLVHYEFGYPLTLEQLFTREVGRSNLSRSNANSRRGYSPRGI